MGHETSISFSQLCRMVDRHMDDPEVYYIFRGNRRFYNPSGTATTATGYLRDVNYVLIRDADGKRIKEV